MELSRLRFQNRYWDNPELLKEDIHLKQLFSAPVVLKHPVEEMLKIDQDRVYICLLYTSPSPRDRQKSRMPSSA